MQGMTAMTISGTSSSRATRSRKSVYAAQAGFFSMVSTSSSVRPASER